MQAHPQRLAWITLIGGLTMFCLVCSGTFMFARWLVFDSPTELNVTLHVGRGTVTLAEPDTTDAIAIRTDASVGDDDRISTDEEAQGLLDISDPYSDQSLATITLHHNSSLTLDSASRPRFNVSDNAYTIRIKELSGRLDVWVRPELDRDISLDLAGPMGTVHITTGGSYLLDQNPTYFQVMVRAGSATLISPEGNPQHITANLQGTIFTGTQTVMVDAAPTDLLPDSTFDLAKESDWPVEWTCTFLESRAFPNAPRGEWDFTSIDGRSVTHIQRLEPNPGQGKTVCLQNLLENDTGLNVTGYETLRLRVVMQIHYQQLSGCGDAGSECPVMLHIVYTDTDGNPRDWYHGFYADYTPGLGKTRCSSCLEDHVRINSDIWYTYDVDLFNVLVGDWRPAAVTVFEVYADGHQYEILLDEVTLLATRSVIDDNPRRLD
ncbi:MAG: hypothetical protein GYB65_19575 [Chloroflexi bacterium]|nr:hypothetical protein [Chloroflexota bacterium]